SAGEHRMRGTDAGMARERHFAPRTEHADAVARGGRRRAEHETGLWQPRPAGDRLHGVVVETVGIKYDGERIARAGTIGEDVELHVAALHRSGLGGGRCSL